MSAELKLRFPSANHVEIRFSGQESGVLPFENPLTPKIHEDIRWYLEVYGTRSLSEPDDREAERIKKQLPVWGKALFDAVFADRKAARVFNSFQDAKDKPKLISIEAEQPGILALPWELLHESAVPNGTHLFHEQIAIRRCCSGITGGRAPFAMEAKPQLHVLFVIARPEDQGFIDPRADALAVLEAIDQHAPRRVSSEFLRPATLDGLIARLEDASKPPVDVLHFDGHGVFDADGGILAHHHKQAANSNAHSLLRDAAQQAGEPNTGYLLFEDGEQKSAFVAAGQLGANLHRHQVGLVILSACQSASHGDAQADPFGCVAVRLTATGIPAVLAMTHSVLVATTQRLFAEFYKALAQGCSLGLALDRARRYLDNHPERYDMQRGAETFTLRLHDWFLPALYQSGDDVALLAQAAEWVNPPGPNKNHNLPAAPAAGFFGRRRELWKIERCFAPANPQHAARRISLSGFGGQGKTALALEAGRWLLRTGMFQAAVFVDYAQFQGVDAVALAVSTLSTVLEDSLLDRAAATQALAKTPTLLILDNLESLEATALQDLLTAACDWSEAGASRVLLTTRTPEFGHAGYPVANSYRHQRILLDGLGSRTAPDDALRWFEGLQKLPPAPLFATPPREALIELFAQVNFHPLSIQVLAVQLKTRRSAELGERLNQLLVAESSKSESSRNNPELSIGLVASLQLSLERLDAQAQALLPRLGVFQNGAFEDDLLAITDIPAEQWSVLRHQLHAAALLEVETLPSVKPPFLRFHPTLAPLLWAQLSAEQQQDLSTAHRERYYALVCYLYDEDDRNPHFARAIVRRELPNLLHAVHRALSCGAADAVFFVNHLNKFLNNFGLRKDAARLTALALRSAGEVGSQNWYLAQSNRGEQLRTSGQVAAAAQLFQEILAQLSAEQGFDRAGTLGRLGRCFEAAGQLEQALAYQQQALALLESLETSDSVQRQRGTCLTDSADCLRDLGRYPEARRAYEASLAIKQALGGELRGQGVVLGQLGTLAMREGNYSEAAQRSQEALALFQQLGEPAHEAIAWHQLGRVHQEIRHWQDAERCYRESARIEEAQGNLSGAAQSWDQLAMVNKSIGKLDVAEQWYAKAIAANRRIGNAINLASNLSNLASLLRQQPQRLAEARGLADEALSIKLTLDPNAAQIWKIYHILAQIAEREAATSTDSAAQAQHKQAARDYRRHSLAAYRAFPGNQVFLQQLAILIARALAAVTGETQARTALAEWQNTQRQNQSDGQALAEALERLLAGDRDADSLCENLNFQEGLIIETILQGLNDPNSVAWLLAANTTEPG